MQLLRVNSNNELVVPPFECAWLSDETLQLDEEAGCLAFEVKGEILNLTSCVMKPCQKCFKIPWWCVWMCCLLRPSLSHLDVCQEKQMLL